MRWLVYLNWLVIYNMTLQERMIPIYVMLVTAGKRTIEDVPESVRDQVSELIKV